MLPTARCMPASCTHACLSHTCLPHTPACLSCTCPKCSVHADAASCTHACLSHTCLPHAPALNAACMQMLRHHAPPLHAGVLVPCMLHAGVLADAPTFNITHLPYLLHAGVPAGVTRWRARSQCPTPPTAAGSRPPRPATKTRLYIRPSPGCRHPDCRDCVQYMYIHNALLPRLRLTEPCWCRGAGETRAC